MMIDHLIILRRHLICSCLFFLTVFILCYIQSDAIFDYLVEPMVASLLPSEHIINTQITSAFITPIYIAFYCAAAISAPFMLIQLWCFIAPGLRYIEKKIIKTIFIISPVLFIVGAAFCFYLVLPLLLSSLHKHLPSKIVFMPDMASSVKFLFQMVISFGVVFQLPILMLLAVKLQWISTSQMKYIRPYFIVFAFTIGMLLTPPDVFSQLALAIPICILFEITLLISRRI